jgi:ABC-type dipeptide/oligopeptide/nickel transport system ATPase component
MVKVDSLCKTFHDPKRGEIKAVDHVSFQAVPGLILGLLGVNGAGKTTTLRMLSTVISPGSGSASVGGFDVATQSTEVRSSIGFVSGSTALYGRLTGRECLEYFGRLYGMDGANSRAQSTSHERLQEFSISFATLSTGQQRVMSRAPLHDRRSCSSTNLRPGSMCSTARPLWNSSKTAVPRKPSFQHPHHSEVALRRCRGHHSGRSARWHRRAQSSNHPKPRKGVFIVGYQSEGLKA